jgi:hypothetical protein
VLQRALVKNQGKQLYPILYLLILEEWIIDSMALGNMYNITRILILLNAVLDVLDNNEMHVSGLGNDECGGYSFILLNSNQTIDTSANMHTLDNLHQDILQELVQLAQQLASWLSSSDTVPHDIKVYYLLEPFVLV